MTSAVMDRPVTDDAEVTDQVRCCDTKVVDSTVQSRKILSRCPNPAEWLYIMKCCGARVLACDPCHEAHMLPTAPHMMRHCVACAAVFYTLGVSTMGCYRV